MLRVLLVSRATGEDKMGTSTLKPRAAAPRAPMPAPPVRQFSFTDFQVSNPTAPPPGDRLDAEFDRANTAIDSTITWASTSLNTDGSIRDGAIGQNQLVSGLFDDVAQGIIDEVQPMVDDAQGFANAAQASSATAQAAATSANTSNVAAQGAADDAQASASSASQASTSAQDYAFQAGSAASTAQNADNHATGEAAWASNYAVLAEAWAEHMPDPIPPNILATMGITGDHWSSRWWATKAEAAFGGLTTTMYLGAWPTPPATTPTGEPITIGAIYYNTTSQQPFIWTGTAWVPFYTPVKSYLLTLLYRAAANQTVFPLTAPDLGGNAYGISPVSPEPLEAYVNGVRVPQDDPNPGSGDWTLNTSTSTITFLRPLLAGSMVQVDIMAPASMLAPTRVQTQAVANIDIDPATGNPGQIDGVRTTFPLIFTDGAHTPVNPGSAQELFISLDGVVQQPNIAYTVSVGNIVFTEAPALAAVFWGYWYGPGLSGTGPGAGFLPITGGTLTGPLTLSGPPSLPLNAATKQYVDSAGFLPLTGGAVSGAITSSMHPVHNGPAISVVNTSTEGLPNSPANSVWSEISAQYGPYSASQHLAMWYPNNNRSWAGIISAAITSSVCTTGMPGYPPAQQQCAISATALGIQAGQPICIVATALAGAPNVGPQALNSQISDSNQPTNSVFNAGQTGIRLQNEHDYFVYNPNTSVKGSLHELRSLTGSQPNNDQWAAYSLGTFFTSTQEVWGIGFESQNSSAYCALAIGWAPTSPLNFTAVPRIPSQNIRFVYTDASSATQRTMLMYVDPTYAGSSGADIRFASGYAGKAHLTLDNVAYLKGMNAAGNATLNLLSLNGQNQLSIGDGVLTTNIRGTNGSGVAIATFNAVANAINNIQFYGAAAGSAPIISSWHAAGGTDTNIGLNINGFGTGTLALQTGGAATTVGGNLTVSGTSQLNGPLATTGTFAAFTTSTFGTPGINTTLLITPGSSTSLPVTLSNGSGTGGISIAPPVTFGGTVTLAANPTTSLQAATKQYVDAARSNSPVTVQQNSVAVAGPAATGEQTIVSVQLPPLSANASVRVSTLWSYPNNANTKTLLIRHSASSGGTAGTLLMNIGNTTTGIANNVVFVRNAGSQTAQKAWVANTYAVNGANASAAVASGTINTAVATYINFNCGANGTDIVTLESYTIEILVP